MRVEGKKQRSNTETEREEDGRWSDGVRARMRDRDGDNKRKK